VFNRGVAALYQELAKIPVRTRKSPEPHGLCPGNGLPEAVALIAMWRSVSELFDVQLSPDDRRGRTSGPSPELTVAPTIRVNI
jgi:hypothetical protein